MIMPGQHGAAGAIERVGVIGCGLIGGSFALAAKRIGLHVRVTDARAEVRTAAARLGLEVAEDLESTVVDRDLVVIATPVEAIASIAADVIPRMQAHSILTDTGSTKAQVLLEVERVLERLDRPVISFIGGHPMAGREHGGVDAADGDLFQGAAWVLTPARGADARALGRLSALLVRIGARVIVLDAELHDRLVATVSHLPQVLASALVVHAASEAEDRQALWALAAGGFRDATRVAGSDPELWMGVLRQNRAAVAAELERFAARLLAVRDALSQHRDEEVRALLTSAREVQRAQLHSKPVRGPLVRVVVPLEDRPGMIAGVAAALGEAGINIEDLSMRHADSGDRGALVVAVAGSEIAERAVAVLAARGISAHVENG